MNTKKNFYLPELDGLRGIAIIFVMLYHVFPYFKFFRFGWIGVDLFFVLSGFLITNVLQGSLDNDNYLKNFYVRRSLRIFPLYFMTLAVFFIGGRFFFSEQQPDSIFHYLVNNQFFFWTFTQNFLFVIDGMPSMPYLTHLWSIAIEEQFYLFWPFFILHIKNKLKWISFLIIIILIWRCYLFFTNSATPEIYYVNTTTRIDSLMIGSLVSISLYEGKIFKKKYLLLFYTYTITYFLFTMYLYGNIHLESPLTATLGYTSFGFLFASFIYLLMKQKIPFLSFILKNRMLIYTGKRSFGLYVFHMPIYLVTVTKFKQIVGLSSNIQNQILLSIFVLGLTYSISIITYKFIELPFLKMKIKFN